MSEHEHKFALLVSGPDCEHCHYESIIGLAMCECGEEIGPSTIERRLNATEKLSAEDARDARIRILSEWDCEGQSAPTCEGLEAYAAALEEEDAPQ